MASTAKLALSVSETGNTACRNIISDIAGFLPEQKELAKKAKEYEAKAKEQCDFITKFLPGVRSESSNADKACTEANKQAGVGNQAAAERAKLSAEEASKKAGEIAKEVQISYEKARKEKHEIMKEIMLEDFKIRDEKLKKLVEDEEEEYKRTLEEIKSEIERLEEEIAKQNDEQKQEKARIEAEELKARLVLQQRKHAELEKAMVDWTKEITDANAFAQRMDQYNYALATATDLDMWLEEYRNLLQLAVPKFLYDNYNTTGNGCLDPLFEDDFTVTVELVEVAGEKETLKEKCEPPDFKRQL